MSETQEDKDTEVSLTPEKVQSLKEEHGVTDEVIEEIVQNVEVTSKPISATVRTKETKAMDEESGFLRAMSKGDVGVGEAMLLMDYQDRKERRRREDEARKQPTLTAEDIRKEVQAALKASKPVAPEEKPEWAKENEQKMDEILNRLKGEEEDKKLSVAIEKATGPLKTQLEQTQKKMDEESTRNRETIERLSKPTPEGDPTKKKTWVEEVTEATEAIKQVGTLINTTTGNPSSDIEKVKAYGDVIEGIIVKAGEAGAFSALETIFSRKPETPTGGAKKPEKIVMPSMPTVEPEEVTAIELEAPVEETVEVPVEETLEAPEVPIEAPVEETVEVPVVAPTKIYTCKHCGESGFEHPWQLASHSKKCLKAIEARKKLKEKNIGAGA